MPLLVVHLAAVWFCVGLVWVVQVLVYPGFRAVGDNTIWREHHDRHARATTVAVTVGVSVPSHRRLSAAYDGAVLDRLVHTNWYRTAAWSAGGVVAVVMVLLAT